MKKFTVLAVLALMVAVAMPVMATDFTWSGELTYGGITDFTNVLDAYANANIVLAGKVDDNNTINVRLNTAYKDAAITPLLDIAGTTAKINGFTLYLDRFNMVTDIGKVLGLSGLTIVSTVGWADPSANSYSLTDYGNEGIVGYDPIGAARDNFMVVVGTGAAFNVMVDLYPLSNNSVAIPFQPQAIADVYGVVGPVSYSVAYTTNQKTDGMGLVGAAATFAQAFGDITPSINAEVSYDLTAAAVSYAGAVKVAYKTMVKAVVGLNGTGSQLAGVYGNVNGTFMPNFGADVDFNFSMATAGNYGVDASLWYLFGKTKARVGYLATNAAMGANNAPASLTDGGLYFTMDLTY